MLFHFQLSFSTINLFLSGSPVYALKYFKSDNFFLFQTFPLLLPNTFAVPLSVFHFQLSFSMITLLLYFQTLIEKVCSLDIKSRGANLGLPKFCNRILSFLDFLILRYQSVKLLSDLTVFQSQLNPRQITNANSTTINANTIQTYVHNMEFKF